MIPGRCHICGKESHKGHCSYMLLNADQKIEWLRKNANCEVVNATPHRVVEVMSDQTPGRLLKDCEGGGRLFLESSSTWHNSLDEAIEEARERKKKFQTTLF